MKETDMGKTVVCGATDNPQRYAFTAVNMLRRKGYDVVPVGIKTGEVIGLEILNLRDDPEIEGVHTVTLYVGPRNQPAWYDFILKLKPERIIFNPGTENPELMEIARDHGIEPVIECTLIMLNFNRY